MAQPSGRLFFPGQRRAEGPASEAPQPAPEFFNPGKNSGGRGGFKGSVALSLLRPVTYRVFRRFVNASSKSEAVLYAAVRRLAWFLGVPMTKAVDVIVGKLPSIFQPSAVCPQCKDNTKCAFCSFHQPSTANTAAEKAGTEDAA